jgi:4-hydroxy-tetrahydrodipicolinate synthase
MRTPFTGVGTALATPFTKAGDLDEAAVRRLGRRQIDAGIHFLCPCGTTGESPTLTDAERLRIIEILVEESHGKVPILAGAGGYDTRALIHMAGEMARRGVSGFLSVTPYYNKLTGRALPALSRVGGEHAAADRGHTAVAPRNVEVSRSRASCRFLNIVGAKEASNVSQMCEIVRAIPPDFLAVGRRCADAAVDGGGRVRIISVAPNEIPGDGEDGGGRRA